MAGSIEGMQALASRKLVSLSEQNIIDCSGTDSSTYTILPSLHTSVVIYGNKGCSGGSREVAILYVVDNNGIDTSKSYPYIESV